MTPRFVLPIFAISLTLLAAGDARAEDAADTSAKDLWTKNCAACHGADGNGQTKMGKRLHVEDMTSAEVKAGFDRERMIAATRDGVSDDSGKQVMKPFAEELDEEELGKVIDYIIGGFGG